EAPPVDAPPAGASPAHAPPAFPTPRPRVRRRWYVAAAALVVAALALGWARGIARTPEAPAAPAPRSLAVLPFANMSADPGNAYFSDGLSEQIITALSQVEGLHVAARTSSFALRDARLDARAIGDTLGVGALLEGSVRREGSRLRVTAQLIDAATGYHLWSGEFDREAADVIAVQDEIARAIADALELRLPPRAPPATPRAAPDLTAYDLYLRALHLRNGLDADDLAQALTLLDRAIARDPDFALAWAAKASVIAPRIYFRQVPYAAGVRDLRVAVDRALALDPSLGEAQVALGILNLFFEWRWDDAGRALRRAVALNPSDPHAWHHLANYLNVVGRHAEAADARARSAALDPLNARTRAVLSGDYARTGRPDAGRRQYERARALDPMHPLLLGLGPTLPVAAHLAPPAMRPDELEQELLRLAVLRGATTAEVDAMRAAHAADGMPGLWRRWLAMDERQSGANLDPLRAASLWAAIGDRARAFERLERAYAERNPGLIYLADDQIFAPLRGDPRMTRVLAGMGLAPIAAR
ncbi:hypothetical protein, partial [Roseisolibacter sp. H3M3-2]|uniref:hypothetical protein n=1 Tax=Roseisolibacter sp. H3M3-2 TaxID=3031323 RepID=UPI0023DBADBF